MVDAALNHDVARLLAGDASALDALRSKARAPGGAAAVDAALVAAVSANPVRVAGARARIALDLGQPAAAVAALREVPRAQRPAPLVELLAQALEAAGEPGAALATWLELAVLEPGRRSAHVGINRTADRLGGAPARLDAWKQAVAALPNEPPILVAATAAALNTKDASLALQWSSRARALQPNVAVVQEAAGAAFEAGGGIEAALAAYTRAAELAPTDPHYVGHRGRLLLRLHRTREAADVLTAGLATWPGHPDLVLPYADVARRAGDLDGAEQTLRTATPQDHPMVRAAFRDLATLRGQRSDANDVDSPSDALDRATHARTEGQRESAVAEIDAWLPRTPRSDDLRALWFAKAKLLDQLGRYDEAWAAATEGNRLKPITPPREPYAEYADRLRRAFPAGWATERVSDCESDLPVTIVGMPRSGTTLAEQVLARHPDVFAAGELTDLGAALSEGSLGHRLPWPEHTRSWTRATWTQVGRRYVEQLAARGPGARRVTDKMPGNFARVGALVKAVPGARIVHTRRSALDTCLSIYFLDFGGYHPYAYDLDSLGAYYLAYRDIMAHWRDIGIEWLEFPYEEVVDAPEPWFRALVDAAGLPWDDRCLSPHEADRVALTASNQQVRQPVYRSSVGRWRHYERHLGPLIDRVGSDG